MFHGSFGLCPEFTPRRIPCSTKAGGIQSHPKHQNLAMLFPATSHSLKEATRRASSLKRRWRQKTLFAELKNQIGLHRLRLRRMRFVREQFFPAAATQNIKRLVRFLSQVTRPLLAVTN